jgi:hypothetical protein
MHNLKYTIYNKSVYILAYTDDTDIVGWTVISDKEAFLALSAATKTMGLKVNEEKMKCTQATKRPITSSEIEIGSYNFEIVPDGCRRLG